MNPLKELETCGQSVWLDYLKRSLIEDGGLSAYIERDGLKGVTSNPDIFEKAIGETDEYDAALKAYQAEADHSIAQIYEHLAIADIRKAADVLRPVFDATGGRDGYVSLECSPYLADNTDATVTEAIRLRAAVDRPNLMVKVPGTAAGIPAIRRLTALGLNINVTLLFSVLMYRQVIEAYFSGLEELQKNGGDLARIASVASFFVSRIDTAVDSELDALGDARASTSLRGKIGIANAKVAYAIYKSEFSTPRWQTLAKAGARSQRLLWASTSTKDPAFRKTMYVEALIGRDTVNTIPPATMDAFRETGTVTPDALERGLDAAHETLAALKQSGISLEDVTDGLTREGVTKFTDAFDQLFGTLAKRRRALLEGDRPFVEVCCGPVEIEKAVDAELDVWRKDGRIRRLWAGDASLWTGHDENCWLGWLQVADAERSDLTRLEAFTSEVKEEGFTAVVLLGMGGSSLGAEVLARTFGGQAEEPRLHVLDSTDPSQIRMVEDAIDLGRTLFIVSSKSGSTLEPNILADYFLDRVASVRGKDEGGAHFVAVTDPGSPLEERAKRQHFAKIFYGIPSIGGRYSVLSKFGLVAAAAVGIDVKPILESAAVMERSCGHDVPPGENPGVKLGVALGVAAARFGRDKATVIVSPAIADFGAWLEQLLAESTGKQGRGVIPLAGEPLASPEHYGSDRFFVYLELEGQADSAQSRAIAALKRAGYPVATLRITNLRDLGAQFFLWEIATAVAGAVIAIDPFDQPDVEASKERARTLTEAYEKTHTLPDRKPVFAGNGIAFYADARNANELGRQNTLAGYLRSHFARARGGVPSGDYVALLAYIGRDLAHEHALTRMRKSIRDRTQAATCAGFGPRFQHSTGQIYKGGPNSGVFLQITCDDPDDIQVPGHAYSFGIVKAAQAQGDLDEMVARGRRAVRVHLKDPDAGLIELERAIEAALE